MEAAKSRQSNANRFFVRVTKGTAQLAWYDIERQFDVELIAMDKRSIDFWHRGPTRPLLSLRSVDDIFVYVGVLHNLDRTRQSLHTIERATAALSLQSALEICQQVREVGVRPNFSITASLLGKRNYSRFDVADAVHKGVQATVDWSYTPHSKETPPAEIDVRVLIENSEATVGIRLGDGPLHRRDYKLNSMPGSLKAPVAYCMGLLSGVQAQHVFLDPTCGVGTIPIEAKLGLNVHSVYGSDSSSDRIAYAVLNAQNADAGVEWRTQDARALEQEDGSVDRIVANLPWGKQVSKQGSLAKLYRNMMAEFMRIMSDDARAVLLTTETEKLLSAARRFPNLQLATFQQISLFGSHPTLCVFCKSSADRSEYRRPFPELSAADRVLNQLVYQFALENEQHEDPVLRKHSAKVISERGKTHFG